MASEFTDRLGVPPADFVVSKVMPSYIQVADQLRRLVLDGSIRPGERLPAEGDLASQFGVSRSTTREALRILASEKLIQTKRGVTGGTFVAHPSPGDIEAAMKAALDLMAGTEQLSLNELMEAWMFIEAPAARLAARRRTDEEAEALLRVSAPPPPGISELDALQATYQFHHRLVRASRNRLLPIFIRPLANLVPPQTEFITHAGTEEWKRNLAELHLVALAVSDRDEQRAYDAMADHIANIANVSSQR